MTGSEVNNNEACESWSKLSEKNGKLSSKKNLIRIEEDDNFITVDDDEEHLRIDYFEGIKLKWKKPYSSSRYNFIKNGLHFNDVEQGYVGDCWFVAVVSGLTKFPNYLNYTIQSYRNRNSDSDYFCFAFFTMNFWTKVTVDKRLPINNDRDSSKYRRRMNSKSSDRSELWAAYLEKAYARLYDGYDKIAGGHAVEAMVDLTGAFAVRSDLIPGYDRMNFEYLFKNQENIIISTGIGSRNKYEDAQLRSVGLRSKHAYSLLRLTSIRDNENNTIDLIRIRNPHGRSKEFKGDWCDSSAKWLTVPREVRHDLLEIEDDGAFWMNLKDWIKFFDSFSFGLLPERTYGGFLDPNFDFQKLQLETGYFQNENDAILYFELKVRSPGYVWIQPLHDDGNKRNDVFLLGLKVSDPDKRLKYPIFPADYDPKTLSRYKKEAYLYYMNTGSYLIEIKSYNGNNVSRSKAMKGRKWLLRTHGENTELIRSID